MKRRGAGTLSRADIGRKVLLQAWVQRRRDHGGVLFLDLRDRSGVAQVVAKPDQSAAALAVKYPGIAIVGNFSRNLSNHDDVIRLEAPR